MSNQQPWYSSKVVKVFVGYWAVIIALTYLVEWIGRHEAALGVVMLMLLVGIVGYVLLRLIAGHRARRFW